MRLLGTLAAAAVLLGPAGALAQTDAPEAPGPDASEAADATDAGATDPPAEEPDEDVPWYRRGDDAEVPSPDPAPTADPVPEPEEEPEEEQAEEEPAPDPEAHRGDFYFGSYGRVIIASDLEGRTGRQSNITTWGPRVDETDTYAEMELRREDHFAGIDTRIVMSVAYGGPLFHFDGEFSERIAIRNLFAETQNILTRGFAVWAGSRMWRGDDIYLFNFWPLDNLNMIGGGLRYALEEIGELSIAGGLAQPNDPFQRQEVLVPARTGFTPDTVVFLDRPRLVLAAKLTWWPLGRTARDGLKAILYYEQHVLPAGQRRDEEGFTEPLPEDLGWVIGAQLGGYLTDQRTFANLFFRYARGLGAYDPLGVPFTEGSVIQTGRAEEARIALSANWEHDFFGLQVGAYWRYFRDADPNVFGRGALTEGSIDLRPHFWFDRFVGVAVDVSYSGMQSTAVNETTGNPEGGNVFKVAVLPFFSPFGRGTYTRPHIRAIYSLTVRDDGARALYPVLDPRSAANVEHFLGVGAEWWFSSSSYGF